MNIHAYTETGYEVSVNVTGSIDEYAKTFLAIFNNVKNDNRLIRVTNDYGNKIFVVCTEGNEDDLVNWLSQFGEVGQPQRVLLCETEEVDFDLDKYDECIIY